MRSIAIMQPVYLPWLGYFEQMDLCDEFVFLDDVKYTKHDWRNRNRIRTREGWTWITVPVPGDSTSRLIKDVEINMQRPWVEKHLRTIEVNYKKAPYFADHFPALECALAQPPALLAELTIPLVKAFASRLGVNSNISRASAIPRQAEDRQMRLVEICRARNAQLFYTGPAAQSYIDEALFKDNGISVLFQNYQHPEYEQRFTGFESHMAIIDILMNCGPDAASLMRSSPAPSAFRPSESG